MAATPLPEKRPRSAGALALLSVLLLSLPPSLAARPSAPRLASDTAVASAGYFRLSWGGAGPSGRIYELQQSQDPGFTHPRLLYLGPDRARLVSGRADGRYYYRVRIKDPRAGTSPWSRPVKVEVRHHSLMRAFGFFSVGALVFAAVTLVIVVGTHRAGEA